MVATFSSVAVAYAPKRKFLEFAKPKFHNKLGEFSDPDVLSWINRLYQDKAFKTSEEFNKAYDSHDAHRLYWRNKTMVITNEDVANFMEEFDGGAFDGSQTAAEKLVAKMKKLEGKVIFVY